MRIGVLRPVLAPAHAERRPIQRVAAGALLTWSLLYALPHLYWGLGGTFGLSAFKPSATEMDTWEAANIAAFAVIAPAGLLGFALERAEHRTRVRLALVGVATGGAAIAAAHGLYGILFRALSVAGVTDVEGEPFDLDEHGWVLWDMLAIEPWFLVQGLLLAWVAFLAVRSEAGRRWWMRVASFGFLFALATAVVGVRVG